MAIVKSQVVTQRGSGGDRTCASIAVSAGDVLVAVGTSQDSNTNNLDIGSIVFNTTENFTQSFQVGGTGGSGQPVHLEIWYLTNPTATTASVVADFNSSINESTLTVYRLTGADASALINGTPDSDTGNGFAPAMSITTTADNCFIIGGLCSESDITGVGTGQTADADHVDQSYENTVVSSEPGGAAGAQAHSYNMNNGAPYAQGCVAIKPAAAGTVSSSPSLSLSPSGSASLSASPSESISSSVSASPSVGYTLYTRADEANLPTNTNDLATNYTEQDYEDVETRNDVRVGQSGISHLIHQFKSFAGVNTTGRIEWEGSSSLSPKLSIVYLQVFNLTSGWETVDSNGSTKANMDFELFKKLNSLTNYKDSNNLITCRVYQLAI